MQAPGRQRTRRSLDVSYNYNATSRLGEVLRIMMCCFCAKSSRISEYQNRMHFAREYRLALGDGGESLIGLLISLTQKLRMTAVLL